MQNNSIDCCLWISRMKMHFLEQWLQLFFFFIFKSLLANCNLMNSKRSYDISTASWNEKWKYEKALKLFFRNKRMIYWLLLKQHMLSAWNPSWLDFYAYLQIIIWNMILFLLIDLINIVLCFIESKCIFCFALNKSQ